MSTVPTLFAKSTAPTTAISAVLDRSLTLMLVLVSGHPVLMQFAPEAMLVSFLAVLLVLGAFRRVKPDFADLLFIMSFFAISVFHIFQFQPVIFQE